MVLNGNSWHARLFKVFFDKDLPNNLCNYFWELVLAVICLPIVWPALLLRLVPQVGRDIKGKFIWGALLFYVLLFLMGLWGYTLLKDAGVSEVWAMIFGFPFILGLIAVCIAFFAAISKVSQIIQERKGSTKKPNIVAEYIRAKKDKICPKIEWKSKNDLPKS